eukprot:Gregarina_sp_Pseudo_9__5289@NODE_60_length_4714_cov_7_156364_g56_i0_p6_GENE_NODE_60_length_4714_cov_7_156364_g56_i0NODE_60_length_4714_cov_7_156364_g56_i0_p6_ORF_typecomplete_len109_score19_67_NODE_60_length_4714_cov_7_156364_g56_i024062732
MRVNTLSCAAVPATATNTSSGVTTLTCRSTCAAVCALAGCVATTSRSSKYTHSRASSVPNWSQCRVNESCFKRCVSSSRIPKVAHEMRVSKRAGSHSTSLCSLCRSHM